MPRLILILSLKTFCFGQNALEMFVTMCRCLWKQGRKSNVRWKNPCRLVEKFTYFHFSCNRNSQSGLYTPHLPARMSPVVQNSSFNETRCRWKIPLMVWNAVRNGPASLHRGLWKHCWNSLLLGVLSYLAQGTFTKRTFNNAKRQKWLRFALNHSPLNYVSHKMLKVSPLCRC